MEYWAQFLNDHVSEQWIANKIIYNLREHKSKYKDFKVDRVVAYFLSVDIKYQKKMCYEPISEINKRIRKSKMFD